MIKESIKKRHIVKYLLFSIICVSLQGCLFYNYGVKMTHPTLKYRTYYSSEQNKKYDFRSVIYALEDKPDGKPSYGKFNISIRHLYKPYPPDPEYKKDYISEIIFNMGYYDDVEVILLPDTIKLIHMTEEREIIPSKAVSHNLNKWPSGKIEFKYIKVYEPKLVPKKLIEAIYLEILVDGEKIEIEYEFPIEKKLEGTFWDAMKGI